MDDYQSLAVILTAVEVETRAVIHIFDGWKRIHIPGDKQEYREIFIDRDGEKCRLITCQQKVMGMTAATMLASKAIAEFRPKYLIMSGISAGIGEHAKQLYGDVIVPDMIWDYSTGKYVGPDESEMRFGDVGFLPRPIMIHTDEEVMKVVNETVGSPDNEFHVITGPMACGSFVVANSAVVDQRIKALFPETEALDMESYSVLYAAENASEPRPKGLVVKSICDFADSGKSDQYQRFAAYTSAGYVQYLLNNCLPV